MLFSGSDGGGGVSFCFFVFRKLGISESTNARMTKVCVLIVRDINLSTNHISLVLDLLCMVQ